MPPDESSRVSAVFLLTVYWKQKKLKSQTDQESHLGPRSLQRHEFGILKNNCGTRFKISMYLYSHGKLYLAEKDLGGSIEKLWSRESPEKGAWKWIRGWGGQSHFPTWTFGLKFSSINSVLFLVFREPDQSINSKLNQPIKEKHLFESR